MTTTVPAAAPRTIVLFGIPFHDVSMEGTLAWIDRLVATRRPAYLVTANLDFAAQSSDDVELQRILVEADLVLCDGTPLVWASKLAGKPLQERVAGSDLAPRLAARAEEKGYKIFLLGGQPQVLERAAKNLQAKHPKLPPIHFYSPPFAPLHQLDNAAILERLEEAKPDILLVAFGCPKQEKWIFMHYRRLGIPCCIGVGATVDFLAGNVSRAPALVAKLGLEWVYRMLQEPKRLAGRYWKDIKFLFRQTLRERRAARVTKSAPREQTDISPPEGVEIVRWSGEIAESRLPDLPMPSMKSSFIVDLTAVTGTDSAGLGLMARIARDAWQQEKGACFLVPPGAVRTALEAARLDRILPAAATIAEACERVRHETAEAQMRPPVTGEGNVLLFELPARLTAANQDAYWGAIRREWESRPDAREIALDMADTAFMDSSGLGFLLKTRRMVDGRDGCRLRLLNPHANVLNVINVAKVGGVLLEP